MKNEGVTLDRRLNLSIDAGDSCMVYFPAEGENTMNSENILSISADNTDDLSALLEDFDAYSEENPAALTIEAKAKDSTFLSSGIPQITELIIALGTSGALTAITTILVTYFKNRPKARLILKKMTKGGDLIEITAENIDTNPLSEIFGKR
jgi:hypothetical protein